MAEKEVFTGNCFICGAELGRVKMKNHILKEHAQAEGGEHAVLMKVESREYDAYWLFLDIAVDAVLGDLDSFLRQIWLECCGHMSVFSRKEFDGAKFNMKKKISDFKPGDKLWYAYDMGTSTELTIAIIAETQRPKQKEKLRLLARNTAPEFDCPCGKPATSLCLECGYEADNRFLCDDCAKTHEHEDALLPVVNSPRMGECAYEGELDKWGFDAGKVGGMTK
jgi:hypothetical protein